jgi:hypothetical protein
MTESNSTLATAAQDSQAHTLKPVSGKTFEQLLGSAGCALILLDSKASTAVARLAVESAAIGTTEFAGIASPTKSVCVSLVSSEAEHDVYTRSGRDLLIKDDLIKLSEPTPELARHDSFSIGAVKLGLSFIGNAMATVKAPPLAKQPERWSGQLEAVAAAMRDQSRGCLVFAECSDPNLLNSLPRGYANALLVSHADADGGGHAFAVRAHRAGALAVGYRPMLAEVWLSEEGAVTCASSPLVSADALTRRMVTARKAGQSLQQIADEYGINKSTVHRRLASAGHA